MKKYFSIVAFFLIICNVFGQNMMMPSSSEIEIEGGTVSKKYKDGKLDSITVLMSAVNYGNALFFTKSKDIINITNAADKNSVITVEVKNKKQLRTLYYKNKPVIIVENINFDIENLPKNAVISSSIFNNIINTNTLVENFKLVGDENPDKTLKLFYRLSIQSDLDNIDYIFENIGDFFSEEDALLKIFYGRYAEKFAPQALGFIKTDSSGKIKDGILMDYKNTKTDDKNNYNIYKEGKMIKSGIENLSNFQKIFIDYREKSDLN